MDRPSGSPPCDVQASGGIELLFYGELAGAERHAVESHLAGCAECRDALEELNAIRDALATRPIVDAPPGNDWTPLMSRIGEAVAHEASPSSASVASASWPTSAARHELLPEGARHEAVATRRSPTPLYLALAATLTLVTASVTYLARQTANRGAEPTVVARVEPPVAAPATQLDPFAAVSEQHFERSKLVILGLASRDPQRSSSSDWAYERQLAGALLDDTRLYKQAAQARGLESLAGVMSDLELVLLQASLSDQQDAATLDRLQRLIRKRDLVSKMEMTRF
jgi:hypothetical protein